jgi:integrase/recombinase XerD
MRTLTEDGRAYVAMRRHLGFKLMRADTQMRQLLAFLRARKARWITTKLAVEFATRDRGSGPKSSKTRWALVRGFARYRAGVDPRTEIPPADLLASSSRRAKPYLYSDEEVRRLLQAALDRSSIVSLQPSTYYCILGLLAVTGMRVSEVLNLRCDHIDWTRRILTVHETKFGKTRLVPLHTSTVTVLADYERRRRKYLAKYNYGPVPFFFVSRWGRRVNSTSLDRMFWELSETTGLRGQYGGHGPRLHDLRHRFAVETLLRWYRGGRDVDRNMYVLSTYLGHAEPSRTYWYLSCTPELMGEASRLLEKRWEEVA